MDTIALKIDFRNAFNTAKRALIWRTLLANERTKPNAPAERQTMAQAPMPIAADATLGSVGIQDSHAGLVVIQALDGPIRFD